MASNLKHPSVQTREVQSTFDKAAYSSYEKVKSERNALQEAEIVYKKRIEALEDETRDLLNSYQVLYEENKLLRGKVENGPHPQRIRLFREEIKKLEEKVALRETENSLLKDEIHAIQKQLRKESEEKKRLDDAFKMERGLHNTKASDLEKDNKDMEGKVERLEKQQQEYEFRMKHYEGESDGLMNRYKQLKRDNLRMESKFKSQKDLLEEEMRETKDINKEMSKELIKVKSNLAKLQSEYNSLKLDNDSAKKQIEFQSKEIDVFKNQSSQLQHSVRVNAREYNRMEGELKVVEGMLEESRRDGFDAIIEERKTLLRREKKHLARIGDLELQITELTKESNGLDKECAMMRVKLEQSLMKEQDFVYAESSYKRRIEALENANIELDRKGKFMHGQNKKGVTVTMGNDRVKHLEKEKQTLSSQVRYLEIINRKLERRVNELEGGETDDFDEDINMLSMKSKRRNSKNKVIRADMSSLRLNDGTSYRKKINSSRSLPSI